MLAFQSLTDSEIETCVEKKGIEVCGNWIELDELFISYDVGGGNSTELEAACDGPVLVILNTKADQSMQDEGVAREVINRIQKLRKKAGLVPTDKVAVYLNADKGLERIITEYTEFIQNTVKADVHSLSKGAGKEFLIQEDFQIKDSKLKVAIFKEGGVSLKNAATNATVKAKPGEVPACKYVNLVVNETLNVGNENLGRVGCVLLENPVGKSCLTLDKLKTEVSNLC